MKSLIFLQRLSLLFLILEMISKAKFNFNTQTAETRIPTLFGKGSEFFAA